MNFDCTKSKIWQGVNPNLLKLTGWVNQNLLKLQVGKPKFSQIIGVKFSMKVQKLKNLQITRMKFKTKKKYKNRK